MSTNINEGAENVNINSASAQTDGIFVPSKEWQDVPDWADPLPPCGEYRTSFNTNRRQARWDNPPGAETVFDKRAGKLQTAGASQKAEQNGDTDGAGTGVRILRIPNHATSRSTAANKVILFFADEKTFTVSDLMSFDRDKDPSNMIGKRWLCKGDSLLIAGPTGIGKSSFIMAMVVNWSLGLDLFGIKPVNALRCLIIQAENNQGDLAIAFQDLLKSQKLSAEQMKQLGENLVFQQVSSKAGTAFVEYAKAQIAKHKPDLIIADPLFSYAGGDVSKQAEMSPFLRNQIQPILNETGVIWAFVHHTGKPPRDGQQSNRRALYDSLGSTDLTTGRVRSSPSGTKTGTRGSSKSSSESEPDRRTLSMGRAGRFTICFSSIQRTALCGRKPKERRQRPRPIKTRKLLRRKSSGFATSSWIMKP